MTMSSKRWSIASAKAELSRVVREARRAPQAIENRGKLVAVVLGVESWERVAEKQLTLGKWRALLAASALLRAKGGATLKPHGLRATCVRPGKRKDAAWPRRTC